MITLKTRTHEVELKWWTFPGGERNVKIIDIGDIDGRDLFVTCKFEGSNDLIDMLLLVNAIRNVEIIGSARPDIFLDIPYFPFARQDRVMTEGEPFALQVAVQLIKACKFKTVTIMDPHSDVLAGMFEPGLLNVVPQWSLWAGKIMQNIRNRNVALVAPDAGAQKKIYKLASLIREVSFGKVILPVINASKHRDSETGEIVKTYVNGNLDQFEVLYVVDDICDGGRTFIELAKAIRERGYDKELVLCVTHGIFSKGIESLSVYDKVFAINNMNPSVNL